MLRKINNLIKNVIREPFTGIGKPEPLKYALENCWSRRINQEHRLVYKIDNDGNLLILQCRYHYSK
jgi:toxin YoeB